MDHDILLKNYKLLDTLDPEVARDVLGRVCGTTRFDLSGEQPFCFQANFAKLTDISLGSFYDRNGTQVGFSAEDVVRQLVCIQGSYRFDVGPQSTCSNSTQWSTLVPMNEKYSLKAAPDSALMSMRIEELAIRRRLEAVIGDYIGGEIRFETGEHRDTPEIASLRRTMLYFVSELSSPSSYLSIAMRELQDILIVNFIFAHRHNFSHLLSRRPVAPAPWQLRRVEEFIEANWDKPISLEDLARAGDASARTLFRHFQNWKAMTPKNFVKQVRLQKSRKMLENPDDTTTVLAVALKCGFQSHGHFSKDYRMAFAELPSETLERSFRRHLG